MCLCCAVSEGGEEVGSYKTTRFYCDVCKDTYDWGFINAVEGKRELREQGWTFGKLDKCPECAGPQKRRSSDA